MNYAKLSVAALEELKDELSQQYETLCGLALSLDLTRGKPSAQQLDLSNALDGILNGFYLLQDGTDVRNYGGTLGISEARTLGGRFLDLSEKEVLVGGNSSLQLMYLYLDFAMNHGLQGPESAWAREAQSDGSKIKFLCPVPGYDRHFKICEQLDIEMINVAMTAAGPDMTIVQQLVERDPLIKGIWCVPMYANPTGQTYDDKTVRALACLARDAGAGFRIMWDNAYAVHHLTDKPDRLLNLMEECRKEGTTDSPVMLASTSKVTFAGAGISFLGTSEENLRAFEKYLSTLTIGFDKVNQLRHARFLPDLASLSAHMQKHAELVRPKFELVEEMLNASLSGTGIASWTQPNGGYFVSLDTLPGLASQIVQLAATAGVKLTPAGSTFPYQFDPADSNIRIAPTFPPLDQLRQALEVLVVCIRLATVNQFLEKSAIT